MSEASIEYCEKCGRGHIHAAAWDYENWGDPMQGWERKVCDYCGDDTIGIAK